MYRGTLKIRTLGLASLPTPMYQLSPPTQCTNPDPYTGSTNSVHQPSVAAQIRPLGLPKKCAHCKLNLWKRTRGVHQPSLPTQSTNRNPYTGSTKVGTPYTGPPGSMKVGTPGTAWAGPVYQLCQCTKRRWYTECTVYRINIPAFRPVHRPAGHLLTCPQH